MRVLKLFVLGSPRLERDGQSLHVERRKAVALLAFLAVTGDYHRRETLATLLWPELDHAEARAALRRTLVALKAVLTRDELDVQRQLVGVVRLQHQAARGIWLDLVRFHDLLAGFEAHGHSEPILCPGCLASLKEAVALCRGNFLEGFGLRDSPDFDDWQLYQAETLRRELVGALQSLVRGLSACGEYESAVTYARRWVALDSLDERAHRDLMALYTLLNERPSALRQFAECVRILDRELGVPPERATIQLYEALQENALAAVVTHLAVPTRPRDEPRASSPLFESERPPPSAPVSPLFMLDRFRVGHLVGRDREMAELWSLWQRAERGTGQMLLVSGEAGVGKTRLVRELATRIGEKEARLLMGRGEAAGSAPHSAITDVIVTALERIPSIIESTPEYMLADLLALAPQLRPRFPSVRPNPPIEASSERRRRFDSFVSWIELLADRSPLLLWIEDAHWADSGTLSLLGSLARRLHTMRLMVILTYRDAEVELGDARALRQVLFDLERERLATSLRVPRLGRDHCRALIAGILGSSGDLPTEVTDSLFRETDGNPFFAQELCKALIEEGELFYSTGAWRRTDSRRTVVPQSVRAAILARFERLPSAVQEVLHLAAILGPEFDIALLRAMSDRNEEELEELIASAQRAQFLSVVQRSGAVRLEFAHALIPFTIRESLSALRLQRLHGLAARSMEAQSPHDFEPLAHHFLMAGELARAIDYWRRAAERAESVYAYDTAIQHLQTVLDLTRGEEWSDVHLAVLERLADVYCLRDERVAGVELYLAAMDLWQRRSGGDPMVRVRLCRKLAQAVYNTDISAEVLPFEAAARAGLLEGIRLMADEPPHAETVRLLIGLSQDAWRMRVPQDWDRAEVYARSAVEMAERLGRPIELADALDALAVVYAARGLLRERLQLALRRLALSHDPHFSDVRARLHLLNEVGYALVDVGEYRQAIPYLREAQRLASRTRAIDELVRALAGQATCAFRLDRWDEVSMEATFQGLAAEHSHQRLSRSCFHLALIASVHALRGELVDAEALRNESLALMARAVPAEHWGRPGHY